MLSVIIDQYRGGSRPSDKRGGRGGGEGGKKVGGHPGPRNEKRGDPDSIKTFFGPSGLSLV